MSLDCLFNHRDTKSTEITSFFARSGNVDRAKEPSPTGRFSGANGRMLGERPPLAEKPKGYRRGRWYFSLAVISRPGKNIVNSVPLWLNKTEFENV